MIENVFLVRLAQSYLAKTAKPTLVVFDDSSVSFLPELLTPESARGYLAFCSRRDLPDYLYPERGFKQCLTFSLKDDQAVRLAVNGIAARRGILDLKIRSLISDLLVEYLSRDLPAAPAVEADARIEDLPMYAIVCTPRSGSTYLGTLLHGIGLGDPQEHLRDEEAKCLATLSLSANDFRTLFFEYVWRNQRNFIFGTKLISHFLVRISNNNLQLPGSLEAFLRKQMRVVYLVRRDKVGQSISDFLANQVKIWHVHSAADRDALDKAHRSVEYNFDQILGRYNFMIEQEDWLAKWVSRTNHIYLDYDDLVADPDAAVETISAFMGFRDLGISSVNLLPTASESNQQLRRRFESDYARKFGITPPLYTPLGIRTTPPSVHGHSSLQSLREFKELQFGQYQKRSWQIADYRCRWSDEIQEYVRADQPEPTDGQDYVLAWGSAHTFAPYVQKGYVNHLASSLNLPFLNFGVGGAGPDFFLDPAVRDKMLATARKAKAVICQVTSCRTMGSEILPKGRDRKNSLVIMEHGQPMQYDSERALVELRKQNRDEELARHISYIRTSWCNMMIEFALQTPAPKILFWFSTRVPEYDERWPSGHGTDWLMGAFPQFINREMIENIKSYYDTYVEVVLTQSSEDLVNRFTGESTRAVFGGSLPEDQTWLGHCDYYPNSDMHRAAAEQLFPAVKQFVKN